MTYKRRHVITGAVLALCAGLLAGPAAADDFYKDKVISIYIGYAPSGGSDLVGRVFARHIVKYIPGKPSAVVKNMPGAGGMLALNYVGNVAKADGTNAFFGTAPVEMQLLGDPALKVDIKTFEFIAATPGTQVFYVRADTKPGVKTAEDIFKVTDLNAGAFRATSSKDMAMRMALDLLGVKYKYIAGFTGNGDARMAVQNGTINAFLEGLPSYNGVTVPGMVKPGLVVPIFQLGIPTDEPERTERDKDAGHVATVEELYTKKFGKRPSGDFWKAYLSLTSTYSLSQRWLGLPPKTPKHIVQIMRDAAMKMREDPDFKKDMIKVVTYDLPVYPGERAERAVRAALDVSPDVKKVLKEVVESAKRK